MLIRTFEASGGRVELGVGGGITVDSVPVREWQECLHKAEPLARGRRFAADRGPRRPAATVPRTWLAQGVFETILAQHGRPLRLADHLARLARSVRELYGRDLPIRSGRPGRRGGWDDGRRPAVGSPRARQSGADGSDVSITPASARTAAGVLHSRTRDPQRGVWRHKWADRTELQAAEELTAPALPYFLDPSGRSGRDQPRQSVRAG